MNKGSGLTAVSTSTNTVRLILAITGALAMAWAVAVFPVFWSEGVIVGVASAVIAGEAFNPDVLAAVEERTEVNGGSMLRSSVLGKVAVIHLRQAEDAIRGGDPKLIKQRLESLVGIVQETFRNAPDDPFLWLAWFWLDTYRNGLQPGSLPFLRMSYDLGPYEGWIAIKRDRVALADYRALTNDLAEQATAEFVGLVRWGLVREAAGIAAETPPALRRILFARLKDLDYEQRRAFANAVYGRELDDVPVPGIAPPTPQIPMPVMPPNF